MGPSSGAGEGRKSPFGRTGQWPRASGGAGHVARFPSHQSELLEPPAPVCPEASEVICSRHAGAGIIHDHDMGPGGRGRALQKMDQKMDRVYPCNHDALEEEVSYGHSPQRIWTRWCLWRGAQWRRRRRLSWRNGPLFLPNGGEDTLHTTSTTHTTTSEMETPRGRESRLLLAKLWRGRENGRAAPPVESMTAYSIPFPFRNPYCYAHACMQHQREERKFDCLWRRSRATDQLRLL